MYFVRNLDKWQPPFRPSQVLYSEFPEDRGRSLDIDRNDISRNGYPPAGSPKAAAPPPISSPYSSSYEPLSSNRLPDDPPRQDYSEEYTDGGGGRERDYPDKDYALNYGSGPEGPARDYPDYSSEASPGSPEYSSSESSNEAYKHYNSYDDDYRDDKEAGEGERDFTLEDFELDPEVVKPYEAGRNSSYKLPIRPSQTDPRPHDEVHEPTELPHTQLEIPATQSTGSRLPTPLPIQATGYPLTRTPVPIFRNPALSLMTPNQPGWGHWKNVLDEVELSNLQVMKPPPLGQAQTWGRILTNYGAGNQQFARRLPLRFA